MTRLASSQIQGTPELSGDGKKLTLKPYHTPTLEKLEGPPANFVDNRTQEGSKKE